LYGLGLVSEKGFSGGAEPARTEVPGEELHVLAMTLRRVRWNGRRRCCRDAETDGHCRERRRYGALSCSHGSHFLSLRAGRLTVSHPYGAVKTCPSVKNTVNNAR
jgi:hypothetical protein